MALNCVCGQTDQFGATLCEFWLKLGECAELGRAYWSVVLWMGEENNPAVSDEVVEVDWASRCFSVEVWGDGPETERGSSFLGHVESVRTGESAAFV